LVAQTEKVGRISGQLLDKKTCEPVVGASVSVVGTIKGAVTDFDGNFLILRLSPGEYTLKISSLEYSTVLLEHVTVVADSTTEIEQRLEKKVMELDKVISCEGRRKIIDKFKTNSRISVSQEGITTRPVTTVDALLEQVVGVQTTAQGQVYIRGGRAGEVSYIVNGVPIDATLSSMAAGVFAPAHGGTAIVNGEPFDAMFFKNHGVNPFVDTEDDHLSTFATDIDDASFILTRSYLERRQLPPSEAVRAEEFINHFNYGYEAPSETAFEIFMDGAPSNFGTNKMWLLRIGIKGQEIRPENRKAANLVFVVDISGSMSRENRLGLVRKSLRHLVGELTDNDRVGIVVYGSRGRVLLEPTSVVNRHEITAAIEQLVSRGSTNAEEGIRLGYEMAEKMFEVGKINRVILCSDGVANVGRTGPDDILKQIKKFADMGITLSTIGFGMGNYNDLLMEKLGNKGNGYYAYVDDEAEAKRIFVDNLTGTLQVIARDVKIQVDFDPTVVRSYRLIGYENRNVADDKFRDDKEDGGEIGSGHSVTALYELKLHDGAFARDLGTIFIRYKHPETNEVTEISRPVSHQVFASSFDSASGSFRLAATVAEFAEILRESYWARGSELKDLVNIATLLSVETGDSDVLELANLISKAAQYTETLAEK